MEREHLISGLIRKRAEIGGLIEAAQDHLRETQTNLATWTRRSASSTRTS